MTDNTIQVFWLSKNNDDYRPEDIQNNTEALSEWFSDKNKPKIKYLTDHISTINLLSPDYGEIFPNQLDVLIVDDEIQPIIELLVSLSNLFLVDLPGRGTKFTVGVCQEIEVFYHFFKEVQKDTRVTAPKLVTLDFYFKNQNKENGPDIAPITKLFKTITNESRWNDTILVGISNFAWKDNISNLQELTEIMHERGVFTYNKNSYLYDILPQIFRNLLEIDRKQRIKANINNERAANKIIEKTITKDKIVEAAKSAGIIFKSAKMEEVIEKTLNLASTNGDILLHGESGVGKELFADLFHNNSSRKNEKFLKINMAAINPETQVSELFGYEGGSYSSAKTKDQPGLFETVGAGVLFLDEIGEASTAVQSLLLRVVCNREYYLMGPLKVKKIFKGQIVFATHRNLLKMVEHNEFREDLYYRIAKFTIKIPPIRERIEDISLLAVHLKKAASKLLNKDTSKYEFSEDAIKFLESFSWSGNVRTLDKCISNTLIKSNLGDIITPENIFIPEELVSKIPGKLEACEEITENNLALKKFDKSLPVLPIPIYVQAEKSKEDSWIDELEKEAIITFCRRIMDSAGKEIKNDVEEIPRYFAKLYAHSEYYLRAILAILFTAHEAQKGKFTRTMFNEYLGIAKTSSDELKHVLLNRSRNDKSEQFPIADGYKQFRVDDLRKDGIKLKNEYGIYIDF